MALFQVVWEYTAFVMIIFTSPYRLGEYYHDACSIFSYNPQCHPILYNSMAPQKWKVPISNMQYIVLTILIGSILWWMIWATYHLMCWSSYVIQFFWFPNVWKWTDGHRYTSFTYLNRPIWIDIIMNPHSNIKHTIRQQRWFTVNFTISKEQELFFIWHIYEKANIFKLHICCCKNNHLFISAHW